METGRKTLDQIALECGTDKSSRHHDYCRIYEKYFEKWRDSPITLIEAGFGGYEHFGRGGESIRMWQEYFTMANIVSFDLYPKDVDLYDSRRTSYYCGHQTDKEFLREMISVSGHPNIIIDDASHINPLTIDTFTYLWPRLKSGGIYVVEDLETSYWSAIASDGTDFKGGENNPGAAMNYFKGLADSVNHWYSSVPDFDIEAIHFWRQIIFILKK
jgi:hypothetical protein